MRRARAGAVLLLAVCACRSADPDRRDRDRLVRDREAEMDTLPELRKQALFDLSREDPSNGEAAYFNRQRK